MIYRWNKFLIEGDELYQYMINNFEDMIDKSNIKHFEIYNDIDDKINIQGIYNSNIQNELINWIRQELYNNRLFNKLLWKPFRKYNLIDMYFGYKYLFQYKHYYFQLGIQKYCELEVCTYCNHIKDEYFEEYNNNSQHFMISLYGWKEDSSNVLLPYNLLLSNNMIEEKHWICQ